MDQSVPAIDTYLILKLQYPGLDEKKNPEHIALIENRLLVDVKKVEKMLLEKANVEIYG